MGSILSWTQNGDILFPRVRWRGLWNVEHLGIVSGRLKNQIENHEHFGSPDINYPYETRLPFRCVPRGESLLQIINGQQRKQLWKIRNNDSSFFKRDNIDYMLDEFMQFAKLKNFNPTIMQKIKDDYTIIKPELTNIFNYEKESRLIFDHSIKVSVNGQVGVHHNLFRTSPNSRMILNYISNTSQTRESHFLRESLLPSSDKYNFSHL